MAEDKVSILQGHFFAGKITLSNMKAKTNATSAIAIMKRAKLRVLTNSILSNFENPSTADRCLAECGGSGDWTERRNI